MSKARDMADSAAIINFADGVDADIQTQIDSKADISNPTFTGAVTADSFSGDGSSLTGIDTIGGYTFSVVSELPASPDSGTIYFVTG